MHLSPAVSVGSVFILPTRSRFILFPPPLFLCSLLLFSLFGGHARHAQTECTGEKARGGTAVGRGSGGYVPGVPLIQPVAIVPSLLDGALHVAPTRHDGPALAI